MNLIWTLCERSFNFVMTAVVLFGGWINLDTANNQYFSCVPGSSDERPIAGVDYEEGFAKIASS